MNEKQMAEIESIIIGRVKADLGAEDGWTMDKASLWRVSSNLRVSLVAARGDVYDLLDRTVDGHGEGDRYAVLTTGWAAPIVEGETDEIAPSKHPERRRVRLLCAVDMDRITSLIRFQDAPTDPQFDESSSPRGALADALHEFYERATCA